jgi:hypothetical protein
MPVRFLALLVQPDKVMTALMAAGLFFCKRKHRKISGDDWNRAWTAYRYVLCIAHEFWTGRIVP